MSRLVIDHDEARYDAIDIAYFIAGDNLKASDGFALAIDTAFEQLANMPGLGAMREYSNPKLKEMRMWPVPGFSNYLVF